MIVISGLLLTLFFGILLSFLVVPTFKPLERIGISYVLGLGVQTFLMFLIYLVVGNYSLFNTLSILIVGNFILLLFSRKRLESFFKDLKSNFTLNNFTLFQKIILGLIAFFVLFSLICTLYWPVSSWDSLVLYDWRAKLFVATGGMEEGIRRGYFFGVPLMTSLAHTWIYFLGGNQPEIIYTLLLLSFILMIYGSIRRYTCITLSLIAVLMITTYPEILIHSTFSYTNFPYMVYFVMSTVYLYLFMNKVDKSYLFPSAILLGLSSWIRTSEPFWIINLIVLLVYSLISKKLWQPVVYISTFFLFRQPWVIYENSRLSYDTTVTGKITEGIQVLLGEVNLLHLQTVVKFLTSNFWSKLDIYLLLFIVFVIWEWTFLRKRGDYWYVMLIVGYVALTVVGTYVFSLTFRDWQIGGSLVRMTMFFPPLIIFFIAVSRRLYELFYPKEFLEQNPPLSNVAGKFDLPLKRKNTSHLSSGLRTRFSAKADKK